MAVAYEPTPGTETWEIITEGTVWVWVSDPRTGGYNKQRVGGAQGGSKILRIAIDDRRYNEELIVEEMKDHNPFRNGMLRHVRTDNAPKGYESDVDPKYHLGPEELIQFFDVRDSAIFKSEMEDISSELVLRRLKDLGEKNATLEQLDILREIIEQRYSTHKSQGVVLAMEADNDGSFRLS